MPFEMSASSPTPIAVVGSSGYSGAELIRLLGAAPEFTLTAAFSDRDKGRCLGEVIANVAPRSADLVVRPQAEASLACADAAIVALATPAEVSIELAPKLLAGGARVIDLSGAFRLPDTAVFREYYGFEHGAPELLSEAHYGLPQVPAASGAGPAIGAARLVANPGCYATAAILALAPFVAGGMIGGEPIFIDGKSGVSGAGRKLSEKLLFMEVSENVSAYRVVDHQHTPEIELALSRVAQRAIMVSFVPHLLPVQRGLITTCFARSAERDPERLRQALDEYYADASRLAGSVVVQTGRVEEATIQSVRGTPSARVGVACDRRTGGLVAAAAIDNLLKGAASQALENLHRMVTSG